MKPGWYKVASARHAEGFWFKHSTCLTPDDVLLAYLGAIWDEEKPL